MIHYQTGLFWEPNPAAGMLLCLDGGASTFSEVVPVICSQVLEFKRHFDLFPIMPRVILPEVFRPKGTFC
jgi:hypothetical protein